MKSRNKMKREPKKSKTEGKAFAERKQRNRVRRKGVIKLLLSGGRADEDGHSNAN